MVIHITVQRSAEGAVVVFEIHRGDNLLVNEVFFNIDTELFIYAFQDNYTGLVDCVVQSCPIFTGALICTCQFSHPEGHCFT